MIRTEFGVLTVSLLVLFWMSRLAGSDAAIGVPWHLSACVQIVVGSIGFSFILGATDWRELIEERRARDDNSSSRDKEPSK